MDHIKIIIIILVSILLQACGFNLEPESYSFDNFNNTCIQELAKAVRKDDAKTIREIIHKNKINIDFKDPIYSQTLLALAIQNNKKNAFVELLKSGADPNKLIGDPEDATPFIYAIENVEDCDLFYVQTLIKYGANPNLEIANPKPGYYFDRGVSLKMAIGNRRNDGTECLELVKLLIEHGANINYCDKNAVTGICEGVITLSLKSKSMETLRYFVIDKKIKVPDIVYTKGAIDPSTEQKYSLKQILNTQDYKFRDFPSLKEAKEDVLNYLQNSEK